MSSFGEELRRERELRQISLREISEATKISFRHLEALEANEFDELPGGVFNRGFVRAYSQFIGVDPESMVTSYLMEEQARQGADAKQDDVMRRSGSLPNDNTGTPGGLGRITAAQLGWGLVAIITIVVLVGSLLVWSWRSPGDNDTTTTEPADNGAVTPRGAESRQATEPEEFTDEPDRAVGGEDTGTDEESTNTPVTQTASMAQAVPPQNDSAEPPNAAPEIETTPPTPFAVDGDSVLTRIRIVRATNGRVNCDNTRIEMLAGVRPGTTVEFLCKRFLLIDISDAGAIELGLADQPTAPLGPDGRRLSAHRIELNRAGSAGPSYSAPWRN